MNKHATHYIVSNGVRLNAVAYGNENHPPIVLVHGYPDNHRIWIPVVERLATHNYVITYDVRGAGESDAPRNIDDYKLPLLAEDLSTIVDTLIPGRRFHLAGHDWGGSAKLGIRYDTATAIAHSLFHLYFWPLS